MQNKCAQIREQISAFLMGGLDADKMIAVQHHIRQCPACARYLEALEADEKLLMAFAEAMEPSVARVEEAVLQSLSHGRLHRALGAFSLWRTVAQSRFAKPAAAAVVIIVAGIGIVLLTSPGLRDRWQVVTKIDQPAAETTRKPAAEPSVVDEVQIEAELKQLEQLFAAGDANGLVEMLSQASLFGKVFAAGYLAEVGDFRAIEALQNLSAQLSADEPNNPFAMAVAEINKRAQSVASETRRARLPAVSKALRAAPDKAKIEAEVEQIEQMAAVDDVNGLVEMLSVGQFTSKVAAAEHLGEIGDEAALVELKRLNEEHGGWAIREIHHDSSGAFAVAICRILIRDLPAEEQIEALFDLLDGRGPAVPEGVKQDSAKHNFDVGKRVATELDEFDDPSIPRQLRKTENKGAAVRAVWMEVGDMETEEAIDRCVQIAENEGGAQRYGAIQCLGKLGEDAIDALDELAGEGHGEAITVLAYQKENPKVFELLCWHLINNKNYLVRREAVHPVAYVTSEAHRPKSLQTLVEALYDPGKNIRQNAAKCLSNQAYKQNKPSFDEIEDSLLIALKHPDVDVREHIMTALERLGCDRLDEQVPEPPPIRTDLEEWSSPPLTAQQRLKAKTEPLERQAAGLLKTGPAEEAINLYEELLELRPDYEPYQKGLEKARAYLDAAAVAAENWYPDAPYIGLKGRYSYLLAHEPEDTNALEEEFELALFLQGEEFEGWSNIFGDDSGGKDQFEKALKLYGHIVAYYPQNEYIAIRAKAAIGGLKLNLYKDVRACVSEYTDIFAVPVEEVIDSSDEQRNKPLPEKAGKTQAQSDFEIYYKDHLRGRVIELCSSDAGPELHALLDEIIERCSQTDPNIVEMAKAAKLDIQQRQTMEAEIEETVEHYK